VARWILSVLGSTSVAFSGTGRAAVPAASWSLIGFLLCQPGMRASRGQVATLLWPDNDEQASRHRLATLLWRLKRSLAGHERLVDIADETLRLHQQVWIDAHAFSRRATRALDPAAMLSRQNRVHLLRQSLRLYQGPFLQGIYQDWALLERERLECLRLDALHALAQSEAEAQNWDEAVEAARLLCALEPLREDGHRILMQGYSAIGNRALALRQYRTCAELLASELGVEPMPQTKALEALLSGRATSSRPAHKPLEDALVAARASLADTIGAIDAALAANVISGGDTS
jgi:DNA-binding SARP family transcriptional activator